MRPVYFFMPKDANGQLEILKIKSKTDQSSNED